MCELAYFIMQEMLSCNRSLTTVAVISCSSLVAAAHTHTHTHSYNYIAYFGWFAYWWWTMNGSTFWKCCIPLYRKQIISCFYSPSTIHVEALSINFNWIKSTQMKMFESNKKNSECEWLLISNSSVISSVWQKHVTFRFHNDVVTFVVDQ